MLLFHIIAVPALSPCFTLSEAVLIAALYLSSHSSL